MLVANKIDKNLVRKTSFEEGKAMSIHYNTKYIEVSAHDNYHIDQVILLWVKK